MSATATTSSTITRIARNITKTVLSREQMDGVGARGKIIVSYSLIAFYTHLLL
jgi:hypothetical protein